MSRTAEEGSGEVCAELCFEAPPSDISRPDPLPVLLVASSGPSISLLDCYNAAIAFPGNNITYFAIIDGGSCFGGYAFPSGWAPYDGPCSLACYNSTEACGGLGMDTTNVAAVFSMGKCGEYLPVAATHPVMLCILGWYAALCPPAAGPLP